MRFNWKFRAAQLAHRRFRVDAWLVDRLADRFERLLALRIILDELDPYIDDKLVGLVGERAAPILHDAAQAAPADGGLGARGACARSIRAYSRAARAALPPPHRAPARGRRVPRAVRRARHRPRNLQHARARAAGRRGPRSRCGRISISASRRARSLPTCPCFAGLTAGQLDSVARLLQPRLAVPDERLISTGDRGDAMYFISSGVVEVNAAGGTFLLTRGDFFGEMALDPRSAAPGRRHRAVLLPAPGARVEGLPGAAPQQPRDPHADRQGGCGARATQRRGDAIATLALPQLVNGDAPAIMFEERRDQ